MVGRSLAVDGGLVRYILSPLHYRNPFRLASYVYRCYKEGVEKDYV